MTASAPPKPKADAAPKAAAKPAAVKRTKITPVRLEAVNADISKAQDALVAASAKLADLLVGKDPQKSSIVRDVQSSKAALEGVPELLTNVGTSIQAIKDSVADLL